MFLEKNRLLGGIIMKRKFLSFLRKYWFLILLNIIVLIGTVLSKVFGDIYVVQSEVLSYNFHSIFVLLILPVYSLMYGIVSYAIYKKIWYPQFLLLITLVLDFLLIEEFIFGLLLLTPCYMVVSFIGIAVILIPYKLIK